MKLFSSLKAKQRAAHLVAIILYAIGLILDIYGYLNKGVEALAYVFLLTFLVYGISISIIWNEKNKRILKSTTVHFLFFITGMVMLFISWYNRIYPTFAFTLLFMLVIGCMFINDLYNICKAYFYDKWE